MYPHFIEVHDIEDEQDIIAINIDNISNFHVDDDGMTVIRTIDNKYYFISETYDELKQLITDAGCLIQMGDPRLDTKHSLTMEELSKMIGEPVWNSNNGQWLIMAHYLDDKENPWAGLYNKNGYRVGFSEDDLIRTPLYRMVQK